MLLNIVLESINQSQNDKVFRQLRQRKAYYNRK